MILPEDLYIRENNEKLKTDDKAYCSDLDLLVPKQVKGMINNYKTKMHDFITKNLNLYENDQSIKDFIQNLYLPRKLTTRPGDEDLTLPPVEIPPQIWQKIEQIKKMGGTGYLNHVIQGIMNKSNFLINELENFLKSLEMEDKDDQTCRQLYREKWIREPSQKLNFKLVQSAQQYISTLYNTKKYDQQEYNEINDNSKYFDELLLPRDKLLSKIPRREELEEKEIPEEKEIKNAVMKLYDLFSDSWSTTIWKFIDDNNTLDNCELFDSNSNKNYLFLKLISQEKEKDNNEEILNMPDNDNMEIKLYL